MIPLMFVNKQQELMGTSFQNKKEQHFKLLTLTSINNHQSFEISDVNARAFYKFKLRNILKKSFLTWNIRFRIQDLLHYCERKIPQILGCDFYTAMSLFPVTKHQIL